MPPKKPKICLLFCSGSAVVVEGRIVAVRKPDDIASWLAAVPEINLIADIDPIFIFGGDASEVQPRLWQRLSREIHSRLKKYDGFVVTHGIDTMLYTSAMVAYMIQPLGKPVIFTGSPFSTDVTDHHKQDLSGLILNYNTLGVKANLINAVQVATMHIGEVAILFGNRLIRGTQLVKSESQSYSVFDAFSDGMIGKVDFGIKLFDNVRPRNSRQAVLRDAYEEHLCLMQLYPGVPPTILEAMIGQGCKGIIVRSFNTNLFPDDFQPVLDKIYRKKIPVVAHNPHALDMKREKQEYVLVNDLTFENTFVRFMWALGQTSDPAQLRAIMQEREQSFEKMV